MTFLIGTTIIQWRKERRRQSSLRWRNANLEKANASSKQWAQENPERARRVQKAWRVENAEQVHGVDAMWKAANPEKVVATVHRYHIKVYKENPEPWRKRSAEYKKSHPEVVKAHSQKRLALKKRCEGSFTGSEWLALCEKYDHICLRCTKHKKLTADHVVPLSKGGSNNISNIQPLCRSCNSRKGTKSIDYRPKENSECQSLAA
jgi:5-methylcytosine-specific restriction endonuclease McrA